MKDRGNLLIENSAHGVVLLHLSQGALPQVDGHHVQASCQVLVHAARGKVEITLKEQAHIGALLEVGRLTVPVLGRKGSADGGLRLDELSGTA